MKNIKIKSRREESKNMTVFYFSNVLRKYLDLAPLKPTGSTFYRKPKVKKTSNT